MKSTCTRLVFILLLFNCSCNFFQNKEKERVEEKKEPVLTANEKDTSLNNNEAEYVDKSVEVKEHDIIRLNGYDMFFEPVSISAFPAYYQDEVQRDVVSKDSANWHGKAEAMEKYLLKTNSQYFSIQDSTLVLKLQNGKQLKFPKWDSVNDLGYNFENFFPDINYYLLRVQFYEGDGWMLVNQKNGASQFVGGRPYFSPDKKQVIAGNLDLEAGYSFNGLQYFIVVGDSLKKEWELEINNWGPEAIKWTSNNSVDIKKAYWTNEADSMVWHTTFSRMKIEKD